ncbi:MAG: Holliday junction branch migration protein RuvA [Lachnospiraceae bacterium]|jgi:Holliday junction DNA helicase RuvA|nr:Holliday junction branch migration protein RuvA [Lachnospiraceae bacterium]
MYAYFRGKIAAKEPDLVIIEVNGIGYNIRISAGTASLLPPTGEEAKLYTYTSVREDAIALYGFLTKDDLDIFKLLIGVNGIGPKGGQSILSVMSPDELRFAVLSGDAKMIAKAPGIGAKTAQRIILDMKDKVSLEDTLRTDAEEIKTDSSISDSVREAVEALSALGYGITEATRAVKAVKDAEQMAVEDILKASLKHLI